MITIKVIIKIFKNNQYDFFLLRQTKQQKKIAFYFKINQANLN